jgi:hypothetical protein
MKLTSHNLLIGGIALLLFSCSSGNQAGQSPGTTPVPAKTTTADASAAPQKKLAANKGGQVVESGKYHLELVPEKSATKTHLDLYVQKGDDHQAIADAKVSGELQSPDGQSQPIAFTYDAEGKHYFGIVPGKKAGAYQLKVKAVMGSNTADGRFSFER